MLEVVSLESFYGRIRALKGVTLTVSAGEIVALVGGNGAGKTTLLRAISGVQPVHGGSITFEGRNFARFSARHRVCAGVVQVPEGRQIFTALSVEDNLLMGAFLRRGKEIHSDIDGVYDRFPILRERRDQRAGNLSGGQQQMLAIGRALMAKPRLLLLDEPSLGLAPVLVVELFATIAELRAAGTTVFLVEQNAAAALALADRAYVLETGTVAQFGDGHGSARRSQGQDCVSRNVGRYYARGAERQSARMSSAQADALFVVLCSEARFGQPVNSWANGKDRASQWLPTQFFRG